MPAGKSIVFGFPCTCRFYQSICAALGFNYIPTMVSGRHSNHFDRELQNSVLCLHYLYINVKLSGYSCLEHRQPSTVHRDALSLTIVIYPSLHGMVSFSPLMLMGYLPCCLMPCVEWDIVMCVCLLSHLYPMRAIALLFLWRAATFLFTGSPT